METETPTPAHQAEGSSSDPLKDQALRDYRRVLLQHKESDARVSFQARRLSKRVNQDVVKIVSNLKSHHVNFP